MGKINEKLYEIKSGLNPSGNPSISFNSYFMDRVSSEFIIDLKSKGVINVDGTIDESKMYDEFVGMEAVALLLASVLEMKMIIDRMGF